MENNTAQILKNNLILLRRNAHLTQEQFADQLGLSFQAVSKWENGLSCPDIALLPEIARIYGISVGQLFAPIEPEELSRPEPDFLQIIKIRDILLHNPANTLGKDI